MQKLNTSDASVGTVKEGWTVGCSTTCSPRIRQRKAGRSFAALESRYTIYGVKGSCWFFMNCRKCVMSNQRPRISFDDEGICSACRYTQKKENEILTFCLIEEFII